MFCSVSKLGAQYFFYSMGFEDLEKELKAFFAKAEAQKADEAMKCRMRLQTIEMFAHNKEKTLLPLWKRVFSPQFSPLAFAAVAFLVLFNIFPGQNPLSAGKIVSQSGVVEVIRGEKVILVEESMSLRKGDQVRVGNGAEADIMLENLIATAGSGATLRIVGDDALFLEKGMLRNEALNDSEVSTTLGFVRSTPGSLYRIEVSESGENRIVSEKNQVAVFDWKEGETTLREGEEVRLRTDTSLSQSEMPHDLKLSLAQLQAIRAKLIIARTKILTGVERAIQGKEEEADRDLDSAKTSFRSIVQVLQTSRQMDASPVRQHLEQVALEEVPQQMEAKVSDRSLLSEARAIMTLLKLVEENQNRFGFALEETNVRNFNRFALLDRLAQFGNAKEKEQIQVLQDKYGVAFMRKILNEPLRIDQISLLNEEIAQLPRTELAQNFLIRVQAVLPPDLSSLLEEKVNQIF